MKKHDMLISPYSGALINLLVNEQEKKSVEKKASLLASCTLSFRSLCDLELLATGGFSPLERFMGESDYHSVMDTMRLTSGVLFPIPVMLPLDTKEHVTLGDQIALRSPHNDILGILTITEIFLRDFDKECRSIFGTTDPAHPLVAEMSLWPKHYVSGDLTLLQLPHHYDFTKLRLTPQQTRTALLTLGLSSVVAFQTRNPIHRAHEELIKRAAQEINGSILIHPVVGVTRPADIEYTTRVLTYQALTDKYFDPRRTVLSLLPLAMRFAGPKEALWHAIIRRNYGANHFIVGRDHASPGKDSRGHPFYGPYDAQQLFADHAKEIGVTMIPFNELVYVPKEKRYIEINLLNKKQKFITLSGSKVRDEFLAQGKPLPTWFTRKEVATLLQHAFPPKHHQGFCVWFTGLPCAGKTTIAEILKVLLNERNRTVTLLDGDVVRTHLSKGLGFSKEDRDTNILRIGFVASEIVRHRGIAICAAVSPYEYTRSQVRTMVGEDNFILVFVDTPLLVCEQRDEKGLYRQAREGIVKTFTGISDPYEIPAFADIRLQTIDATPQHNAQEIISFLTTKKLL
ncbi:MAG: bifunctional sulfate adenylyltransferase/adenylylsulfate kinase [Candidatus Omnitrophica bacterium]|nr:bifunctional sulfate adenylyltransferase/adenylylsulfate kinase [Candidatus Omnitrophota bacterium]